MENKPCLISKLKIALVILNLYCVCASKDDRHALEAIRAQITVDHSGLLSKTWTANTSICSWTGVSCGFRVETQRVIGLDFSDMGLAGRIPPDIGSLSFLTSLDLSNNSFHGSIPEEIGNLSSLQDLMLNNNELTGPVPQTLFNQSSFRQIELSFNSLSGTLPDSMCDQFVKLRLLFISGNNFTGAIPSSIYKCQQLRYLSMEINRFNSSIPREIGNLTLLEELLLGDNDLRGSIPVELGNLRRLKQLSIYKANLVGHVPEVIFNMSSLRSIIFHTNSLSGFSSQNMYTNLPNLQELFLSDNMLTGPVPHGFWKLKGIQMLKLSMNYLTGSIPQDVGNLTQLKWLYLGRNKFIGTIPNEIGYLDQLEALSLKENSFTGRFLFNMSTLKKLDLTNNSFSGALPADFGFRFPNLQELYLSFNKFQGILPNSIINASKLSHIAIVSNSFTGSIPITIGRLQHLEVFVCGGNYFTTQGSELNFLSSLTNSRKLQILSFAQNPLKAFLPASIGNLSTSLDTFQAHECGIKGNIPSGIGNLTNLRMLGLDNNELEGNIPTTLGKLQNLGQLFLEYNKLQGGIPQKFCDLKNLGELYLSHNRFSGIIPPCLGDIGSLSWLFLDSNTFTSTIPPTLWTHKSLVSLNLSSNLLIGKLPSTIGSSNSPLNGLDLSFNRMSGEIPTSIGSYQMLNKLSLAHNKLQGSIPESLGALISLEFLDLSQNNLSGLIPKSLEALRYLQYLNLSYNWLQGEIPIGGLFSNYTASSFMHNKDLCGAQKLQVLPCRSKQHESRALSALMYILPIVASIIGLAVAAYLLRRHRNRIRTKVEQPSLHEWTRISYYELVRATNSFDESNLIGNGAYGSVFKGELSDGVTVAIKVFNLLSERALKSFNVECEVLRSIRHRNLIKIISSCTNMDFRCLVLEYMSNGSLEQWLYSHNNHLNLVQRLQIMIDVALALEYLHHGQTTPIIHRDLKPSNVLLDEDMNARVCDFGIAKIFGEEEFMLRTATLGTIGYMAPEYGMEGIVSTGGDVYSFGILLLETFTRKKPTTFSGEVTLRSWALEAAQSSVFEVVDENLIDEYLYTKQESLASIFNLAMDCTSDSSSRRINMKETVVKLCKIKKNFLANN